MSIPAIEPVIDDPVQGIIHGNANNLSPVGRQMVNTGNVSMT